jgi:surface protein
MYKLAFLIISFFISSSLLAADFITRWDMSKPGGSPTAITFGVGITGPVSYTWETIPALFNGSGTFSGTTATITGLPAGAIIRLHIDSTNFNRIIIDNGVDRQRLVDVEQWGNIAWISMENAFNGCSNLSCTATDLPDLTLVNSMEKMFRNCSSLNGPTNINNWNTSNVTNMQFMFNDAFDFNQPIGNWNTGNVTNMQWMFSGAQSFNQPIGTWNTSNVINMETMFSGAQNFNQPIGAWNTTNVTNMSGMFWGALNFNQFIGSWNTGNVTKMNGMFFGAQNFNQPIGAWNTGNVTNMASLFNGASVFNQPIESWNTSNVEAMSDMFRNATNFNQPIGAWNTGNVVYMAGMFYNTIFNQPIGAWNTSNVTNMQEMFAQANDFNQPIVTWNTSSVTNMKSMFWNATSFNRPLGSWNTDNVTDMSNMFDDATNFNQPIGTWNLNQNVNMNFMLAYCGMDCSNYSATLNGWAANPLTPNGRNIGSQGRNYDSTSQANRAYLINSKGWTINGDSLCAPLTIEDLAQDSKNISVYPNPTNTILHIKNSELKELKVFNSIGQHLLMTKKNEIDMSAYSKGIYYLKCENQVVKVVVE